ncbi:hypothetical protein GCM10020370_12120 [Paenibacillus hodogayensis]
MAGLQVQLDIAEILHQLAVDSCKKSSIITSVTLQENRDKLLDPPSKTDS